MLWCVMRVCVIRVCTTTTYLLTTTTSVTTSSTNIAVGSVFLCYAVNYRGHMVLMHWNLSKVLYLL